VIAAAPYREFMASPSDLYRLDDLIIDDEDAFASLPVYQALKAVLVDDGYRFSVPAGVHGRWDRALVLNLTFWGGGSDVLPDPRISADVVTHVAWHHLAARAFAAATGGPLSVDALFMGEAIASAFDLYLVGRLMARPAKAPPSSFLETQVPAMAETADAAGLSARKFEKLLQGIAADPDQAFEDLRCLLFDVSTALVGCVAVHDGLAVLERFGSHRFAPLLHRFELSNWVLWARAWAADRLAPDATVRAVDAAMRQAPSSIDWMTTTWLPGPVSA